MFGLVLGVSGIRLLQETAQARSGLESAILQRCQTGFPHSGKVSVIFACQVAFLVARLILATVGRSSEPPYLSLLLGARDAFNSFLPRCSILASHVPRHVPSTSPSHSALVCVRLGWQSGGLSGRRSVQRASSNRARLSACGRADSKHQCLG